MGRAKLYRALAAVRQRRSDDAVSRELDGHNLFCGPNGAWPALFYDSGSSPRSNDRTSVNADVSVAARVIQTAHESPRSNQRHVDASRLSKRGRSRVGW